MIKKNTYSIVSVVSLFGAFAMAVGMLFQMDLANSLISADAHLDRRENYERKYRKYQTLTVPQVKSVQMKLDIYPHKSKYRVAGTYEIQNTTNKPLNEIFVSSRFPLNTLVIEGAETSLLDDEWNVRLFKLNRPLKPGQSLTMRYDMEHSSAPFNGDASIVKNGSQISQRNFAPVLGYVWANEIFDEREREARGLPAKTAETYKKALYGGTNMIVSERTAFEATVSTSSDQVAITAGDLVKKWTENGRNFYRYKMDAKVLKGFVEYFSADYKVTTVTHQDTQLEFYYYPEHGRNIQEMVAAVKATMDYAAPRFGAYLYKTLRIVEVPGRSGKALSGIIAMGEDLYTRDTSVDADINVVSRRTIHEVLHQWWGEMLTPKMVNGMGVIVEGLTVYSQNAVIAEIHGQSMTNAIIRKAHRHYFSRRSFDYDYEKSLVDANRQQYLNYNKASIVFHALEDMIGEDNMARALKAFMKENKKDISATITDLIFELHQVSDPKDHALINEFFHQIITYDLALKNAAFTETEDGQYQVTVVVNTLKESADPKGKVKAAHINETISIALYVDGEPNPVTRQRVFIGHESTTLTFRLTRKPDYIVIDPNLTRLDFQRNNNRVEFQ